MAGDWLKFEKATLDKPEVFAIASALDLDPDAVVGKLIRVWSWFDTHTVDGNARSVTSALLDRVVGVAGFVTQMHEVGWVVITDEGVSLPNFDRHNGKTAKNRALTASRAANHRAKSNAESNAVGVTSALPREEKRREEKKKEHGVRQSAVADPCPHEEILALYHDFLPGNPKIKAWTGKRRDNLRARWREDAKRQDIAYWVNFFKVVGDSDFLTGRTPPRDGRPPFCPGLDWMVLPENFAKIIEGRYVNKEAA